MSAADATRAMRAERLTHAQTAALLYDGIETRRVDRRTTRSLVSRRLARVVRGYLWPTRRGIAARDASCERAFAPERVASIEAKRRRA